MWKGHHHAADTLGRSDNLTTHSACIGWRGLSANFYGSIYLVESLSTTHHAGRDSIANRHQHAARAEGYPEIAVPRKIIYVDAIPVLGTGKTDYVTLKSMAANV